MDPTAVRVTRLGNFAHWKGHRNFMAYIGDDKWRTYVKVRVNCKYNSTNSKIVLPHTMQYFRRTTNTQHILQSRKQCSQQEKPHVQQEQQPNQQYCRQGQLLLPRQGSAHCLRPIQQQEQHIKTGRPRASVPPPPSAEERPQCNRNRNLQCGFLTHSQTTRLRRRFSGSRCRYAIRWRNLFSFVYAKH